MSDFDEQVQAIKPRFLEALQELLRKNSVDIDEYLDLRDTSIFDADWTKAFELIKSVKSGLKAEKMNCIEEQAATLREAIFMFVVKETGSSDLAGAISDDAGLIFEAHALQVSDEWVNALHAAYLKPSLPAELLLKET